MPFYAPFSFALKVLYLTEGIKKVNLMSRTNKK